MYGEESGETGEPQQPIRRKYRKFILRKSERYVKKEENAGKYEYVTELANGYEIPMSKKDAESDGKEGGEKGEPQ